MRVILMHNPTAGSGDHGAHQLADDISAAGHELVHVVTSTDALAAALRDGCDVVAAAGGDGTVDRAAHVLSGTNVPLTVLPLGTANNVARSLGLHGSISDLVRAWSSFVVAPFDTATATMSGMTKPFIEGFGFGAFSRVMRQTERVDGPTSREDTLARDLKLLKTAIAEVPAERYALSADGQDLTGDYLMVELLNIGFIGPAFRLAPAANPRDGKLDVVLIGDAERDTLLGAVDDVIGGRELRLSLPVRQAAHVVVRGGGQRHHCDGRLVEEDTPHSEIQVVRGALHVLAPALATS